jgi:predicted dithiol-disulfide oxidoreductase (DUF899 family)
MEETEMQQHRIVSRDEWLAARKEHLAREKEFTRLRDELSAQRRELPWERVEKRYTFEGPDGAETLAELFAGRSQLIVYHFMFHPSWDEGCPSCSFWADNFIGIDVHLAHRDVAFVAISNARFDQIAAFKERMGWSFKWVSAFGTDFNRDYGVAFTPEEMAAKRMLYNFDWRSFPAPEAVGISVFAKDESGDVFRTYSCYSRGVDMLNGAYHYLDLVPKGRDEAGMPFAQAWVRHHDKYPD